MSARLYPVIGGPADRERWSAEDEQDRRPVQLEPRDPEYQKGWRGEYKFDGEHWRWVPAPRAYGFLLPPELSPPKSFVEEFAWDYE